MVVVIGILLALLALLGGGSSTGSSEAASTPVAAPTGSILVVARACPSGITPAQATSSACAIWSDGAAVQATDLNGNAWGMNASRDATLPGNPVIYSLDGLALGTYVLGAPDVPSGYNGFFISGAQLTTGGQPQVTLSPAHPHAEITVFFLKNS